MINGKLCQAKYLNGTATLLTSVYLVVPVCCKLLAMVNVRSPVAVSTRHQATGIVTMGQTTALCCTHHVTAATLDTNT